MDYERVNHRLTGKYYLKKRFFGGYNVMVEEEYNVECTITLQLSPLFRYFRKANNSDLRALSLPFE